MIGILNFFFFAFVFIIFMVIFVVVAVLGRVKNIISAFTGQTTKPRSEQNNAVNQPQPSQRKKIIPADEGEYVDFEEIK